MQNGNTGLTDESGRRIRKRDKLLHEYIQKIIPSKKPIIKIYDDFNKIAKDIFSFAKAHNSTISCLAFHLYSDFSALNAKLLNDLSACIQEKIREDDIIGIDYNNSAIFLLLPDASWFSIDSIESRIYKGCILKNNIYKDTYFIGVPSSGTKAVSLNPNAQQKEFFLNKLNQLVKKISL